MMERTFEDPEFGPVLLRKLARSRRTTLRVSADGRVRVTLPLLKSFRDGIALLEANREWVRKTRTRVRERQAAVPAEGPPGALTALRARAQAELPLRLRELADRHGFRYNAVRIKNNRSNWGSCSVRGNINLNLSLVLLPEQLRDYVLLHELCHLKHPDHSPAFHALLEEVCPGHRALQRTLRGYKPGYHVSP